MGSTQEVFVSSVLADEWADDPDVPGTQMHELVHEDGCGPE